MIDGVFKFGLDCLIGFKFGLAWLIGFKGIESLPQTLIS